MGTVRKLCTRGIMLEQGVLVADSEVGNVVDQYLSYGLTQSCVGEIRWNEITSPACEEIAMRGIRILGPKRQVYSVYDASKPIDVEIQLQVKQKIQGMRVILTLLTTEGGIAFASTNHTTMGELQLLPGEYNITCSIPANLLNSCQYIINVHFGIPGIKVLIQGKEYLTFTVEGSGGHGSHYAEKWPGVVAPRLNWTIGEIIT